MIEIYTSAGAHTLPATWPQTQTVPQTVTRTHTPLEGGLCA
jgi:hypothetical protein